MAMKVGKYAFASNVHDEQEARNFLWHLELFKSTSPLAVFLLQSRKLPLGRPGLMALGKLSPADFRGSDTISIKPPRKRGKRKKSVVILPNVFWGIDDKAIRAFLRASQDPHFLQETLRRELFYPCGKKFTMSHVGRLFEAVVGDHHASLLIRIANFRRKIARWPRELLVNGGDWVARSHTPPPGRSTRDRGVIFQFVNRVRCDFRNWTRDPRGVLEFEFPEPPENLSPRELHAYKIVREIVLHCRKTNSPRAATSIVEYLRCTVRILESNQPGGKTIGATPSSRQSLERIKKAHESLGYQWMPGEYGLGEIQERKLELSLVPIRFLEGFVFSKRPPVQDIPSSTAHVMLLIDLFTGRRVSDFVDVGFSDFSRDSGFFDLSIPTTKVRRMRGVRLSLSRLLPPSACQYIKEWSDEVARQHQYHPQVSLFELLTGKPRIYGSTKTAATKAMDQALVKSLGGELTRLHVLRYSFANWAPVAAILCWHPDLREHPRIRPWVKDSLFFSDGQMAQWKELCGCATADPFEVVSRILAHTSTDELQCDYFINWCLLMEISAILVDLAPQI